MAQAEKEVITPPTRARAWIHFQQGPIAPTVVHMHFCGVSFEHIAQVLIGDAHPRKVAFIVFDRIVPELDGSAGLILGLEACQMLEPVFEFGHELIHR